jgi:hypothetical protein
MYYADIRGLDGTALTLNPTTCKIYCFPTGRDPIYAQILNNMTA